MSIKAEVETDQQHGPIVRVTFGDTIVAVYLVDETAVVTSNNGQYGLETCGSWTEFKASCKIFN